MSTTLEKIVILEDEYTGITSHAEWTEDDRWRIIAIRAELAKLWPRRRAELVYELAGPPRCLGGGTEHDQQRVIAHGIAPLPGGAS